MDRERGTRVSQMRKGVVELAVLGLLRNGEQYGSQLVDELGSFPGLAVSVGTIYPLLSRLRQAGLVTTQWHESPVGPPRKYYGLTEAGRQSFESMREAWQALAADLTRILEEER